MEVGTIECLLGWLCVGRLENKDCDKVLAILL